jgi:hypothetical protein
MWGRESVAGLVWGCRAVCGCSGAASSEAEVPLEAAAQEGDVAAGRRGRGGGDGWEGRRAGWVEVGMCETREARCKTRKSSLAPRWQGLDLRERESRLPASPGAWQDPLCPLQQQANPGPVRSRTCWGACAPAVARPAAGTARRAGGQINPQGGEGLQLLGTGVANHGYAPPRSACVHQKHRKGRCPEQLRLPEQRHSPTRAVTPTHICHMPTQTRTYTHKHRCASAHAHTYRVLHSPSPFPGETPQPIDPSCPLAHAALPMLIPTPLQQAFDPLYRRPQLQPDPTPPPPLPPPTS